MFKKPCSTKSNTNVRNSDRKKLLNSLSPECTQVIPSKATFSLLKLATGSGENVDVYMSDKDPVAFKIRDPDLLLPTLYLTWLCPSAFPILTIPPPVMEFIENGADLMLPGIYVLPDYEFPTFNNNDIVAIGVYSSQHNTIMGPVAVGISLMSSSEILSSEKKGKAVRILHVNRDHLWELGTKSRAPIMPTDDVLKRKSSETAATDENSSVELTAATENIHIDNESSHCPEDAVQLDPGIVAANNDELLAKAFLWALKSATDIPLPIDAGQFYATYILKNLPDGTRIDLKKTSFKKFSTFLQQMNNDEDGPFTKVVSKKGVESIHEVKSAVALAGVQSEKPESRKPLTRVSECYSVTEAVAPFLRDYNFRRGDVIQPNQLRDLVITYANQNKLMRSEGKKIELDDTLQTLVRHFLPDHVGINELVQKIASKMTRAFVATLDDGRRNIRRNQMPIINLKVEKRSGNKVVTLINDTAFFGLDAKEFCHKIQTAVAAGASISNDVPNCEGPQILVHGNQIYQIGDFLQNDYGINKKYIKGLELGIKPKTKKK